MSVTKATLFIVGAFCLVISFLVGIGYGIESVTCEARWRDSGMESSYGLVSGCLIKHEGHWIPQQNYRELE
mgnify:CR=1 FL=1